MFSKKDRLCLVLAMLLIFIAFILMASDPEPNGFGFQTLWLAPPLLALGFAGMIPGIMGIDNLRNVFETIHFKTDLLQHLAAIVVFGSALAIYVATLEPTASLWDCSEFIASAYKLQVPHTPGNPLLLIIGRIFSMLALGDTTRIAWCINLMSAFFASATVFLSYYILLHLGKRIINSAPVNVIAAACGSLCLAFSDTFWFSAVEAETYAASCFFLVLLIFMILKGNDLSGPVRSRFLILICYIAGLSFCIHPMCLLALPVLPIVWYTKSKKLSLKNILFGFLVGISAILFINRFIAVGIFELAFFLDRILVNDLHLPFYSGGILMVLIIAAGLVLLIRRFPNHRPYLYSALFLLIGFMPHILLLIRSNFNPPIDEGNPENLSLMKAYMNREGYPTRPLLSGPYFDAKIHEVEFKDDVYYKTNTDYKLAGKTRDYKYDPVRQTILPRIYSNDASHIHVYKQWTGLKENEDPDFVDNVEFLIKYQLGHMYFRYLMFNFAGRASDMQNSDWLKPWDMEDKLQWVSKARNQYWMIPWLIGIIGVVYQYKKDKAGFVAVFTLFSLTGFLLAAYLNSTPGEPRERDYIYVGSYIAFAWWIGLGVVCIVRTARMPLQKFLPFLFFVVPLWMLFENYDDHNRHGRTFQVDHARNVLSSCDANAILFTGGDNDTFPLWYLQEVEGFRTDIRVVVLSYLNTDWYINQLRNTYYDSRSFNLTLDKKHYRQYGLNDALYVQEQFNGIQATKYLELLKDEHPALTLQSNDGDSFNILPSRNILVAHDNPASSSGSTTHPINLKVDGNFLSKNGLAILDLMVSNPDRPVYFNFTSMNQSGFNIDPYLIQEGQVFRLQRSYQNTKSIDTSLSYSNLIEKGKYDNLLNQQIFFNYEDYEARIINPLRISFNMLALALIEEGKKDKAKTVLDHAIRYLYQDRFIPSFAHVQAASILLSLDNKIEAEKLALEVFNFSYYQKNSNDDGFNRQLAQYSAEILHATGRKEFLEMIGTSR